MEYPSCEQEPLVKQFIDHHNKIEMDQCWSCYGVWSDIGEIDVLRSQYATIQERSKAANSYIDEVVKQQTDEMAKKSKLDIERYNHETRTRFHASLYAVKALLTG